MGRRISPALRVALGDHGCTAALRSGEVEPAAASLEFVSVRPMVGAYRRMIRQLEFDVCEMAPTTYLIAREAGIPITALPIFMMRRFHHDDVSCRTGTGIEQPRDLEGREVGLRAYSVTTGVWVRGFLEHQYGVDLDAITWVVDDDEHVESLALPPNVRRLAPGESVAAMFAGGRLDAALGGNAGTGRAGPPSSGWERAPTAVFEATPLIRNSGRAVREWYGATAVYPIHALLCVRQQVLEDRPWIAATLTEAFESSKQRFLRRLRDERGAAGDGLIELEQYRRLSAVVGDDPLPYGVERNQTSLEALIRFSAEQGLIAERPQPGDLFWPSAPAS